jgi:hypothetical protein
VEGVGAGVDAWLWSGCGRASASQAMSAQAASSANPTIQGDFDLGGAKFSALMVGSTGVGANGCGLPVPTVVNGGWCALPLVPGIGGGLQLACGVQPVDGGFESVGGVQPAGGGFAPGGGHSWWVIGLTVSVRADFVCFVDNLWPKYEIVDK